MDNVKLNYIRDVIGNMSRQNHLDVLKILVKYDDVVINSNRSGIRVNLSELKQNVIEELSNYIKYIQAQENALNVDEKQKETYKNVYFNNKT
jgi:hypothetical protein